MIYIIGGCFLSNHKEECIVVKNKSLMIEEMTNIVGVLANLYCCSTNEDLCLPIKLLNVLCERFECKERKHKYTGELESIQRRIQPPMLHTTFVLRDELVIWIDVREAMDYTKECMWGLLNTYFKKEDMERLAAEWKGK